MQKQVEFYNNLRVELQNGSLWPSDYLFKFIVPTETSKINAIESYFDKSKANIKKNTSRNGKYTSVSIKILMKNPDLVIDKYKEIGAVEGVISM